MTKNNKCCYCEYFLQHYIQGKASYLSINCGNCLKKKKLTKNSNSVCEYYKEKSIFELKCDKYKKK